MAQMIDGIYPGKPKYEFKIEYDDLTHTYKRDGIDVPSVTQILKDVGVFKYPEGQNDYANFGSQIHDLLYYYELAAASGKIDEITVKDESLVDFLVLYDEFRESTPCVLLGAEFVVYSDKYNYAGRVDRLFDVVDLGSVVLDIKTGKPADWHKIQAAAYSLAINETYGIKVDCGGVLYFTDGYDVVFFDLSEHLDKWFDILEKYEKQKRAKAV